MTTPRRDPEVLLSAYLAVGMEVLPDWVVDAVLDEVHRTRQQRRLVFDAPWRIPTMNSNAKLAIAAVVVVVVVIGGLALLRPGESSGQGGAPAAIPSPTPSPSAAASRVASPSSMSTADWIRFTSKRYGYQVSYPASHTGTPGSTEKAATFVAQAQRDFAFGTDTFGRALANNPPIGTDRFEVFMEDNPLDWIVVGPDCCQIGFWGFAATIPAGTSVDDVISRSRGPSPVPCESEVITIDGQPGRLDVCGDGDSIAVAIVGDRAYVFYQGRGEVAKDLMMAQLKTVKLPTT